MAGNSGNPIDTDLVPSNIRNGIDIFGVIGTYTWTLTPWLPANTIGKFSPFAFAKDGSSASLREPHVQIWFVETATDIYSVVCWMGKEDISTWTYFLATILKIEKVGWAITEYQSPYFYLSGVWGELSNSYIRYDASTIYIGTNDGSWIYIPFDTTTDSWWTPSSSVFQDEWWSFTTLNTTTSAALTSANIERFAPDGSRTWINPWTSAATSTLLFSWDTYSIDCKYFNMAFPDVGSAEGMILVDAYLLKT